MADKKKTKKELFFDFLSQKLDEISERKKQAVSNRYFRDQEDCALQMQIILDIRDKAREIL